MYSKLLTLLFLALVIINPAIGQEDEKTKLTEGIDGQFLKTLVSLEVINKKKKAIPVGSGFLVRTLNGHIVLVTAKHVVTNKDSMVKQNLAYRLREKQNRTVLVSDAQMRTVAGEWFLSKTLDIACRFIALPDSSDAVTIPYKFFLQQKYIRPGAPVLVLGFPLGLRSEEYANPIVRKGIVARSDLDALVVDGAIFKGNSGGPVIYVPTIKLGKGLTSTTLNEERVIGLVSFLISYVEKAISQQTRRTRIIFEDNAGLANIVPADAILDLLKREDVVKFDENLPSTSSSRNK